MNTSSVIEKYLLTHYSLPFYSLSTSKYFFSEYTNYACLLKNYKMNILHEYLSAALIKVELLVEVKWTSCRLLKPDTKSLSGKVFIYFTRAMPKSIDFTESYQYQSLNIFYIWRKKLYIFIFALIWAVMWVWIFCIFILFICIVQTVHDIYF